jgi:hypothetical protein
MMVWKIELKSGITIYWIAGVDYNTEDVEKRMKLSTNREDYDDRMDPNEAE